MDGGDLLDPLREIERAMAATSASNELRGALQVIADSVCEIAGFEAAAASVLHASGEFEFVGVGGSHQDLRELVGRSNPMDDILAELALGDMWGRFRFVPHDRQADLRTVTWRSAVDYPDEPGAWHRDNLLAAPLRDAEGRIVGLLAVDLPVDGRVPGPETRALLNVYAEQAERAVVRAIERDRLATHMRVGKATHTMIRRVSALKGIREALLECREELLHGFGATGLWLHLHDREVHSSADLALDQDGQEVLLPDWVVRLGREAARRAWREQMAAVFSRGRSAARLLAPEDGEQLLAFLEPIGVAHLMLVPLGAGEECLGALVLTRGTVSPDWNDNLTEAALELGRDLGQMHLSARLARHDRALVARLEELDAYKSQLIHTVAHELKNPLTTVRGHLEILEDEDVSPAVRHSLRAITRGSERLRMIVEDLLVLSEMEATQGHAPGCSVDLGQVVRECIELAEVQLRTKGQWLDLEMPEKPVFVGGEQRELTILVSNLLSNAVKYSPGQTGIEVRLEQSPAAPGDLPSVPDVRFVVADRGIGISGPDQERLFTEFFRSSNPQALAESGSGLGLAIVSRLVQRLGGTIEVDSELGVGTTLTVTLPGG